jgi:pimeloyl-ACP methyl ester carboxylesterase
VLSALEGEEDDLVLVGHSLGGLTIPLVAARRPLRRMVFLCALIPVPGRSFADQVQTDRQMLRPEYAAGVSEPDEQGRRSWLDFDAARRTFFADCDEAVARSAFERLRPQAQAPYVEPCPLESLPDVERAYVLCTEDRIVNPEWSARAARERLGVEPIELPGSHSPFLSRPAELARVLDELA